MVFCHFEYPPCIPGATRASHKLVGANLPGICIIAAINYGPHIVAGQAIKNKILQNDAAGMPPIISAQACPEGLNGKQPAATPGVGLGTELQK